MNRVLSSDLWLVTRLTVCLTLITSLTGLPAPRLAQAASADNVLGSGGTPIPGGMTAYTDTTDTTGFSTEPGEAGTCGNFSNAGNNHSGWYAYTPALSGWLEVDTFGSDYDTVLEAFTSTTNPPTAFTQLTSLACNDDSGGGVTSALNLAVTAGTTYYLVVRDYNEGTGGTAVLNAAFASQQNIYINRVGGNDANPGTLTKPVKTIQRGVNLASANAILNVLSGGTYGEVVSVDKTVNFSATLATTVSGFVLSPTAQVPSVAGPLAAPQVTVFPGAPFADALRLLSTGGTLNLPAGTFTQTLSLTRTLTVQGPLAGPRATFAVPGGTAVSVSGGAPTVRYLDITSAATGFSLSGGTPTLFRNNLAGTTAGVNTSVAATLTENWWGATTGPTTPSNPGGTGSALTGAGAAPFAPWCTTAAPTCDPLSGVAQQLQFTLSPVSTTVGNALTASVRALDGLGNPASNFTGNISLTIASGTPGATLTGVTTLPASAGVVTFTGLSLNRLGLFTLQANATGLTSAVSAPFYLFGNQLVFATTPFTTRANAVLNPAPVVQLGDGFGNVDATFNGLITVTVASGPGTLSGTTTLTASAGAATFGALALNRTGAHTLQASAPGYTSATSTAFHIAADRLTFTAAPGTTPAGGTLTPFPAVQATDGFGTVDTLFTAPLTVSIQPGTGTGGAVLTGTRTLNAVAGAATYTNLSINLAGINYRLRAEGVVPGAGALSATVSAPFTITAGAATRLQFNLQPATTRADVTFTTTVRALDANNNLDPTFAGPVSVTLAGGTPGATLAGTVSGSAVAGVVTFATSINYVGTAYTLTASSPGLTSAVSSLFNITAKRLVFTQSPPVNVSAGAAFTSVVRAQDDFGNTDTTFNASVTPQLVVNPSGATLNGGGAANASAGVVTFTRSISLTGVGYVLSATSGVLLSGASTAFTITPAAASALVFSGTVPNGTAGVALTPAPAVRVVDALGNLASNFVGNVTVSLQANPGGSTLSGATTVAVSGGVASFPGLSLNRSGVGYTVLFTSTGLASATSNAFDIAPGPAAQLFFNTTLNDAPAGAAFAPQPVIRAEDALGNLATGFTGAVTVQLRPDSPPGPLNGTTTVNAVGGVATFGGLNIVTVGANYVLSATSPGLGAAASNAFTITTGAATVFLTDTQPFYTGAPQGIPASTSPAGLGLTITYTGTGGTVYGPSTAPPTNAGTYVAGAVVSDPNFAGSASSTWTIRRAPITITLSNLTQFYNGTPRAVTTATTPVTVAVIVTYTASGYGPTTTPPTNAGAYSVQAVVVSTNYTGTATNTLTILPTAASVVITDTAPVYTGLPHAPLSASVPGGLNFTVLFSSTSGTVYGPSANPPTNAGTYLVTATISETNYSGGEAGAFTIQKAAQTITSYPLPNALNGEPPVVLTWTASSGLSVIYTTSGACFVVGNTLNFTTGTCTVFGNQPGDANYLAASTASRTFTVTEPTAFITFPAIPDQALGDPPLALNASITPTQPLTYTSPTAPTICALSGSTANLNGLGVCTLTASSPGALNVTRAFSIVALSLNFPPIADRLITAPPTFTVNANTTPLSRTVTLISNTPGVCTLSGATVTILGPGTCSLTASADPGLVITRTFNVVDLFRTYLPLVRKPRELDLVGRLSIAPGSLVAGQPLTLTAVITNLGETPTTAGFWVDIYIDPLTPPTTAGQPWNLPPACGNPCLNDGIAWFVNVPIPAGQALTYTFGITNSAYSRWNGTLTAGPHNLYLYVDSWGGAGNPVGAIVEGNEANNRFDLTGVVVAAGDTPLAVPDRTPFVGRPR